MAQSKTNRDGTRQIEGARDGDGLWSSFARQALFSFIFQTWHFSSSSTLEIVMTWEVMF